MEIKVHIVRLEVSVYYADRMQRTSVEYLENSSYAPYEGRRTFMEINVHIVRLDTDWILTLRMSHTSRATTVRFQTYGAVFNVRSIRVEYTPFVWGVRFNVRPYVWMFTPYVWVLDVRTETYGPYVTRVLCKRMIYVLRMVIRFPSIR